MNNLKFSMLLLPMAVQVTNVTAKEAEKPNVLFILVDDFGWMDVGYNGSTFYETPNLDRLSNDFMQFNKCYTPSPMSSPTRASIMLGTNPARHGITQWLPGRTNWPGHKANEQIVLCPKPKSSSLPKEETTIGEALKFAGYETGFYGKWHMGSFKESGGPEAHGFDESVAVIESNACTINYPFRFVKDPSAVEKAFYFPNAKPTDTYTELLTDSAIDFVSRDRDKPFFLYLAHYAMHAKIWSKPDVEQYFKEKAAKLPQMTEEENKIHDPYAHEPYKRRQDGADYAGELFTLDESIGRLIDTLKAKGLYDNTIIVITGDNGGRTAFFESTPTSVQPLRGGKTFTFDGGLRVPLLIHWPEHENSGVKCNQIVTSSDFYPTILEMVGADPMPEQHKDGVSFAPLFENKKVNRGAIYSHFPHYQGEGSYPTSTICEDGYKLIVNYHQGDMLLYNIAEDISESKNLAKEQPKRVEKMRKKLFTYLKGVGANIPQPNPNYKDDK